MYTSGALLFTTLLAVAYGKSELDCSMSSVGVSPTPYEKKWNVTIVDKCSYVFEGHNICGDAGLVEFVSAKFCLSLNETIIVNTSLIPPLVVVNIPMCSGIATGQIRVYCSDPQNQDVVKTNVVLTKS